MCGAAGCNDSSSESGHKRHVGTAAAPADRRCNRRGEPPELFDELGLLRHRRRRALAEGEVELVADPADMDDAALGEAPEEQLLGQRLLDVLLDDAAERSRAEQRIV